MNTTEQKTSNKSVTVSVGADKTSQKTVSVSNYTHSPERSTKSVPTDEGGILSSTTTSEKVTEFTVVASSNSDVKYMDSVLLGFGFLVAFGSVLLPLTQLY